MLGLLLDFPSQCQAALDIARKAKILFTQRDFSKIVFAGLGGSAIGADLIKAYLYSESKLPISVLREYEIPAYIGEGALVFAASYSGNTEETLSAYEQIKVSGATMIALSSGGKLKDYALRDKITFIEIPAGIPPRCGLGYQGIIPLFVLFRLGLISDPTAAINETVKALEELKINSLHPKIGPGDNIAKNIALKLRNKFAVIYSAAVHFDVCSVRMRGQLAENAKALSSSHVFPEMNHNEIVGWEQPRKLFKDFVVLMLRDKAVHPRVAIRMDITEDILKKQGIKILEIWSRGEGLLSRIFSLIYIGDFVSYYLAILYGIDPTPVDRVTYLKKELSER
jgi:glucose/mannose-6-phosphate isomerase